MDDRPQAIFVVHSRADPVRPAGRATGTLRVMNAGLQRLLDAHDGVVAWSAACRAVSEDVIGWATRSGQLVLPYPRVLVDPLALAEPGREGVLLRAALECAGPGAALSHTSALAVWRLPVVGADAAGADVVGPDAVVHVTTDPSRRVRVPGIVGHRRSVSQSRHRGR